MPGWDFKMAGLIPSLAEQRFSLEPVFPIFSVFAASLEVEVVSELGDLFQFGLGRGGWRLFLGERFSYELNHGILLL